MGSNEVVQLLPLAAIIVLMYALMIRPARRRQRELAALQAALSQGDEILLTSGVFGHVVAVAGETVDVEVAPRVIIKVHRAAVGKIVTDLADTDVDETGPVEGGNGSGGGIAGGPDAASRGTDSAPTDSEPNRGAH
ncbi:MAG: preprotein translocase subunit YajC [Propionibacteriales bacterium]|nr:preprotein translocase subunit YajC [Propionibacteriales bacterium]